MIKAICFIILLVVLAQTQTITPYYILPVQTTRNTVTSYSFLFHTDTRIGTNAKVSIAFPFEFSPNSLNQATRVRYAIGNQDLQNATWSINLYTYTIQLDFIPIGNITIVIDNIRNPKDYTTSSYYVVETLFKNVVITRNSEFGRIPFTKAPTTTSGGLVKNKLNTYIEQGSSYRFLFTPSKSYPANSTLRFIFPEGFSSNRVQCNVSGIVDRRM